MKIGVFTHADLRTPPPGKAFTAAPDSSLTRVTNGSLIRSDYQTRDVQTLAVLAQWMRDTATASQHLTAGIADHAQAVVVPASSVAQVGELPVIARSNEHLRFPAGPALMCVDSDSAGQEITFDQVWQAVTQSAPAVAGHAAIQTSSSSACVTLGATQTGLRGIHTFFHVTDGQDIPRALTALHQRMMLAGFTRHKLSESGAFLARSFADQALKVPSQPIYLKASVTPPVTQQKLFQMRDGVEMLDTRACIPDLTTEEAAELTKHLTEAEAALRPEMDAARDAYLVRRTADLAARTGLTEEAALNTIEQAMDGQVLGHDFVLHLKDGTVTVGEILRDPQRWNGVTCCDPIEPDYPSGPTVAKIFTEGRRGRVHSFAHAGGDKGTVYRFVPLMPEVLRPIHSAPTDSANWWDEVLPAPLPPLDAGSGERPDVSHDFLALEICDGGFSRNARLWGESTKWLLWDGRRWFIDERMQVWDIVRGFLRRKAEQVLDWALREAAAQPDDRAAGHIERWGRQTAHNLRQAATNAALHQMLCWTHGLAVTSADLDADPMLLGTPDGVVDLRTGVLRPAERDDLITQCAGCVPAAPGTHAPIWEAFLHRVMDGDAKMIGFLQRAIGYALTGLVTEQKFLFMTGGGRNGKGVFLNTVLSIMQDYGRKAPANLFLETRNQEHSTAIAGLRGKRFVFGSEIPKGAFWNETVLKDLTGGDMLTARFMRADYFDFAPQFLLCIAANSKPALRDTSQAIRDRLLLVPFDVYIPPEERDPHLPEKLKAEWPAILRWAVDGCLAWQAQGLNPPDKVRVASDDYVTSEDFLGQFLDERCVRVGNTAAKDFAEAYNAWRGEEGLRPIPKAQIVKDMADHGIPYQRTRLNGTQPWAFIGVGLKIAKYGGLGVVCDAADGVLS
ncbi:phage/plasmid primase, P4 family [Ruegeria sp. WL0004]|uniref:Phage/plasmid primase, P4 family n=1 Tax=Ruegeria marisflavi TaxID=2984152 RepID=A0ABT2WNU3_9RHOB|nr:phage/plasmid primase, P4 family [Ruegeria sp. WL0004]MCU9837569.1 phage/plasmid primase, P4 family [Ruegeria sp. WL0004]